MLPVLFVLALSTPPSPALGRPAEVPVTVHATGTFDVTVSPLPGDGAEWGGFARLSIDKRFQGDLEGTSRGQMLAEGGPGSGAGGYVALERVTGVLGGRRGSFVLQHSGTLKQGQADMTITVVPGSGTGELAGLAGCFHILAAGGRHSYEFDYTLPGGE